MRETYALQISERGTEDKYIIYRPLLGIAFIGNGSMAQIALDLAGLPDDSPIELVSDAVKFLMNIGFLIPDLLPAEQTSHISTASLLITNRCQLRCGYCYAAAGAFIPKILKLETAFTAIDTVCGEAQKINLPEFKLEFHGGGEPSLEWEVLTKAVEYTRKKPLNARIGITSNAMWSEYQCEWLVNHMDSISISMDGNEKTQNHNRPLANGSPSFPIVIRNLKFLDRKNFPYGIRMTAIPPWNQLSDNVRFIVEETSCKGIQVEPAFNTQRGEHGNPRMDEVEAFVNAFQEGFLIAKKHLVDLRYAGARPGIVTRHFCSAPYNALVVNPDDEIVTCYEVVNTQHNMACYSNIGRVEHGQTKMNQNSREKLHSLMEERFKKCSGCFCRWTCAGDCYVRVFQPGPEGHLIFNERCEINRRIMTFLLLNLISDGRGVWRRSNQLANMDYSPYG